MIGATWSLQHLFVLCPSLLVSYHHESMHDQEADFWCLPMQCGPDWARGGPDLVVPRLHCWCCHWCCCQHTCSFSCSPSLCTMSPLVCEPYTWKYGCMRAHRIKKQTGARLCCQHHVFVHRCVCSALCMRTQSLRLARVCQVEGCNSATTSLASECGFGMSWRRF